MRLVVRFALLAALFGMTLIVSGCRYGVNRYYDFRDTFAIGAGVTAENPVSGWLPPSFGAYLEVTDFFHLGAITHNGYTAELDLRGSFAGPEYRTRFGFFWWQMLQINQDYDYGVHNVFKDREFPWVKRMGEWGYRSKGHPAKRVNYEHWAMARQYGQFLKPRGWQYWEYIGAELAVSEPFITHFGIMLRLGIDPSEISDFVLGWFGVDFKHDDLTAEEHHLRRNKHLWREAEYVATVEAPALAEPVATPVAPPPAPVIAPEPVAAPAPVVTPEPTPAPAPAPEPEPVRRRFVVHFDYDSSALSGDALEILADALQWAGRSPGAEFYVKGYASSEGTDTYNNALSLERAKIVRSHLVSQGITDGKVFVVGLGEADPVANNQNEDGRAQNRRAEIDLVPAP